MGYSMIGRRNGWTNKTNFIMRLMEYFRIIQYHTTEINSLWKK